MRGFRSSVHEVFLLAIFIQRKVGGCRRSVRLPQGRHAHLEQEGPASLKQRRVAIAGVYATRQAWSIPDKTDFGITLEAVLGALDDAGLTRPTLTALAWSGRCPALSTATASIGRRSLADRCATSPRASRTRPSSGA